MKLISRVLLTGSGGFRPAVKISFILVLPPQALFNVAGPLSRENTGPASGLYRP
jgi:hypothetical protein